MDESIQTRRTMRSYSEPTTHSSAHSVVEGQGDESICRWFNHDESAILGHVENENAGSKISGVCVTSAWAAHGRMRRRVAEEERMQHGNHDAGLLHCYSFGSKSSVAFMTRGKPHQQTRAEFGCSGCLVVPPDLLIQLIFRQPGNCLCCIVVTPWGADTTR